MTDNKTDQPQLQDPINDVPSQDEIIEKPLIPPPDYVPNNMQPQYYNPNNQPQFYAPPGVPQQVNQAYPVQGQVSDYPPPVNYNNDIEYNYEPQKVPTRYIKGQKILVCVAIVLIIIFIIDTVVQILFSFNPFILADDVAILTMAIIFLCYVFKYHSMNRYALGAAIIITLFVGFGIRGFVMASSSSSEPTTMIINAFIMIIRPIALVIGIIIVCHNRL